VVNHLLGVPGVEIDAQDTDGMTALMHAARLGSLEVRMAPTLCSSSPSRLSDNWETLDERLQPHLN
jgi:ankyrin repeat protein